MFEGFLRDEGFKQLGTMIEMMKIIGNDLLFTYTVTTVDAFCQSGSRQWPILSIGDEIRGLHLVVLKGHKIENGKLMLNIRDSAKDPNNSSEIWIEDTQLTVNECAYFELNQDLTVCDWNVEMENIVAEFERLTLGASSKSKNGNKNAELLVSKLDQVIDIIHKSIERIMNQHDPLHEDDLD